MSAQPAPIEVFYSCTDADGDLCNELDKHLSQLRRDGLITTWHKRQIIAGMNRTEALDLHLDRASVILLLVSSDFLASDYCYGVEMRRAMERHDAGEAHIIPILLRPVDWQSAPFGKLQALPSNGMPITKWRNRDTAFADVSQGIRAALQEIQRLTVSTPSTMLLRIWNVPYLRNPHFTGRDELLDRLDQQLSPKTQEHGTMMRRAALTQPRAIKGLGGIGKTQIAVEYAYRSRDLDRYFHTFWINAASEEALLASFTALAELLPAFASKDETDQRKLVEAVKHWLEQCKQWWLLIFDNADNVARVSGYLPQRGNGSILLTTRADAVGSLATSIEVETMSFIEGTHLLLRRVQRFEHASEEEINEAGNIVVALDHFPLALDQAGAYIEETKCRFVDYLEVYRSHRKALLARRGTQATNYPDSVATTWSLSFQKVGQANPAAAELLCLFAFLAPDRIPEELIQDGAIYWPSLLREAASDRFTYNQMLEELLKFSLVKRLAEDRIISIHRLVQIVQMDAMGIETRCQWAERVVRAVNNRFPDDPQDVAVWSLCLRYLDQVQVCNSLIEQYAPSLIEGADLLARTGLYLSKHASYTIAEPLYLRALQIREEQLGPEHPDTAHSLNDLAWLYLNQGKYAEAESLYQRALVICEHILGPEHSDTARNLKDLAWLYRSQGKYVEAKPLLQQALAICEYTLGPEHPDTAGNLNDLACFYQSLGKYAEAEPLYQRALAICEHVLGPEHLDTIRNLNDLAWLYRNRGKYAEAEPVYQRALATCERVFGPEHPTTAQNLNDLAWLYRSQERFAEAEPLYRRSLAICERIFGPEHPRTAQNLNDLACLYLSQGKYIEAEPLYQRSLAICEHVLGPEHPDTARNLNDLAWLYRSQERFAEAEPLYQRSLAICEHVLGSEHPRTAQNLNDLAWLCRHQERFAEAELLYRRSLAICERVLGLEHPDTARNLNDLAWLYLDQGKCVEAEPLLLRALAICEHTLGQEHPDTARDLNDLAWLYLSQERYREAEPLLLRALSIRKHALGPEHSDTAKSLNNLATLYQIQEKNAEAEPLLKQALAIYERVKGQEHPLTQTIRASYFSLSQATKRHEEVRILEEKH